MKKALAWLLVITMTAALAVGGTLAYLTDTDEDVNVMTVGKVKIDQLEYERVDPETKDDDAVVQEFHNNKPLLPAVIDKDKFDWETGENYVDWEQIGKENYTSGIWNPNEINNEVDKMVFVENKGDYDAYVRTVIAFEAGNYTTLDEFNAKMHLNLNETDWDWEWTQTPVKIGEGNYFIATATYNKVLAPGALTEISLSQIALDPSATNEDVAAFGDTYQVLVQSQAIQADGFDDPHIALTEGFGVITVDNTPFETDQPVQGIDVRTALHYLNGDGTTKITDKITKVVFGLNKDHADVVNNYDGTLVTDEQDVAIHSYYVEENGKYTVYFLGNGDTCLPQDSSRLFQAMTSLTSMDTSSLNTGKTELMDYLFYQCSALRDIDVSDFDTSKVTTMRSMFNACNALPAVDVSDWDTSNVVSMYNMFKNCHTLTELDLRGLDLDSAEGLEYMFNRCYKLRKVDVTGWDTRTVKSLRGTFMNCYELGSIVGIEGWKLPANEDMYYTFQMCYPLESLDLSGWGMKSVKNIEGTFFECTGLKTVDVSGWNVGEATSMEATFYFCRSLEEIKGIGAWDVSNVTSMHQTFRDCSSLVALDVKNWNTGKVVNFSSTFSAWGQNTGNMKLKDIDVSQWDMSSAENLDWMFYGCGELTDLDLSNWDVSNVTTMHHTFADCFKMENYNFSGWDTSKVTSMNGIFNSNRALKVVDVSDFDTQNMVDFNQFFDGCSSLETVIGMDQWDTSSGEYFFELFTGTKVREVDLSSFDMTNAKETASMFSGNSELTTIYVGDNWNLDPTQLEASGGMFGGNPKLTGANGTTTSGNPTDATYARIDTEETPGYLTHINDKPVNP